MKPVIQTERTKCIVSTQFSTMPVVVPQRAENFSLHWNSDAKKNEVEDRATMMIRHMSRMLVALFLSTTKMRR